MNVNVMPSVPKPCNGGGSRGYRSLAVAFTTVGKDTAKRFNWPRSARWQNPSLCLAFIFLLLLLVVLKCLLTFQRLVLNANGSSNGGIDVGTG